MDATVWPLFGLRIRSGSLEMRVPDDEDIPHLIELARRGVHDPHTMPFLIPWTDTPSPRFEREFAQWYWLARGTWRAEDWRLMLVVLDGGERVGVQDIHGVNFAIMRSVDTGSWLGREHQGRGIGSRMREAALTLVFDHLGAEYAWSAAFEDNHASRRVSEKLGYAESGWKRALRRGVPERQVRYVMDREAWRSRPRAEVTVSGVAECRELFGV